MDTAQESQPQGNPLTRWWVSLCDLFQILRVLMCPQVDRLHEVKSVSLDCYTGTKGQAVKLDKVHTNAHPPLESELMLWATVHVHFHDIMQAQFP